MLQRIRTIKPEFFRHEGLYDLEKESGLPIRVAFAGLWTCCDREGRFRWRPRELKTLILPYDDVDFSEILRILTHGSRVSDASSTREALVSDASSTRGYCEFYTVNGEGFGYIPTWKRHQRVNPRERASELPGPTQMPLNYELDASSTREARVEHATATRAVREREQVNHKTPLPPVKRGEIQTIEWAHELIEIEMGRKHRLPPLGMYVGTMASEVAAALTRKGFPARVCHPGAGEEEKKG